MDNNKVFSMKLSKVYPLLIAKAERKGRTADEVNEIIFKLTGYDSVGIGKQLEKDVDYGTFFKEAPLIDKGYERIMGVICGCRVEKIEDPVMRLIRCLDKLIDELAKGKTMEKIMKWSEE